MNLFPEIDSKLVVDRIESGMYTYPTQQALQF